MLSITQFEVYVFDHGRWTIHARYPSDQRRAAIMDARTTEFTTGFPTKVVVETYFPEIDESELVTAYLSPKARQLREAAKSIKRAGRTPTTAPDAAMLQPAKRDASRRRRGIGLRQYLLQGFVAAALSLVAATISTVLLSWGLRRAIDAGLPVSAGLTTAILTYSYALLFLFFFMSLFRSKLPLHRVLSYLWQESAQREDQPARTVQTLGVAISPKLRPKQSPAIAEAEAARAREQLRVLRGDPSPDAEADAVAVPLPAPAEPEMSPQLVELLTPDTPRQKRERERKERKEAEARAKAEKAEAAARAAADAGAIGSTSENASAQAAPPERAPLRTFVSNVVQPAMAGTMPNDPVARRGASLVIAGAAAAVAETASLSDVARQQLIEDALTRLGMNPASATLFLRQHDELTAAPANIALVNIGRSGFGKHLAGLDVVPTVAAALAAWRTAHGQPAGAAVDIPIADAAPAAAGHDIYLLTDLRMGTAFAIRPDGVPDTAAEAMRDAAMGLHNNVVRSVLGTHGGHEVKHTGSGIFADFKQPGAAVAAAVEIQRRFTASFGAKLAVALVADANGDDPLLTSTVILRAQGAAAQANDGEVVAERRVQTAAAGPGAVTDQNQDDPAALVKISIASETDGPALYEHVPMSSALAAPIVVPVRDAAVPAALAAR